MHMKYQDKNMDWAKDVPDSRFESPYEDYGWEPGESVLPEFRGPSVHLTMQERRELMRELRQNHERLSPYDRQMLGRTYRQAREPWTVSGPHTGRGPQNYHRSDERIYEDVCQRLTMHGQIDPSKVQIEVHQGEVLLRGSVDSRRTKRMVEDTIDTVSGVQDVHNELTIRPEE